ncbi:Type II and III secretion system protein [Planctomycetales bacterium 10988]|nr:Type II and III secretion system protein [Planctomycetales bacterium 10988]
MKIPTRNPQGRFRKAGWLSLGIWCVCSMLGWAQGDVLVEIYTLQHLTPQVAETQLRQTFANTTEQVEVMADTQGNRVLVRGTAQVQQWTKQLLEALDRPLVNGGKKAESNLPLPAETAGQPHVLKSYAYQQGDLEPFAAQLQQQFSGHQQVRIAADARTNQLLVFGPTSVQNWVVQQLVGDGETAEPMPIDRSLQMRSLPETTQQTAEPLTTTPSVPQRTPNPYAYQPPSQQPPQAFPMPSTGPAFNQHAAPATNPMWPNYDPEGDRQIAQPEGIFVQLRGAPWAEIFLGLRKLWGDRLFRLRSDHPEIALYELRGNGDQLARLYIHPASGRIQLQGDREFTPQVAEILRILDGVGDTAETATRLVALQHSPQEKVQFALDTFQAGAPSSTNQPARPTATRNPNERPNLMARMFQPRTEEGGEAATPPEETTEAPVEGEEAAPSEGGLVGTVQVEPIEGLDAFVIRGNERDVQRVLELIDEIERLSAETEPVIVVEPLEHVSSQALSDLVQELYEEVLAARRGTVSITPLVKPNALLLIGREESVKTVRELIDRLDQPVDPAKQFETFHLKHASAAAAAATVEEFFAERTGLGTRLTITTDYRTNSLIVQASPRDLAEVALVIERLDSEVNQTVNELRVFPLQNSLADELAPVLQEAIAAQSQPPQTTGQGGGGQGGQGQTAQEVQQQQSLQVKSSLLRLLTLDTQGQRRIESGILTDVRITADPRANSLLVSAPPDSMELIAELIRQLDDIPAAEAQIKVFTIVNGDAESLVDMLQQLFATDSGQTQGPQGLGNLSQGETSLVPLRFSVDARTNSIIASGSPDDLTVVEAILLRLDGSDIRERKTNVYRLENAPAADVAVAIDEFLSRQAEIRQDQDAEFVSPFEQIEREVVVVAETVTNALIISATPRFYDEIMELVEAIDRRPPMVMIQVLIAEVALNNTDEFGVELGIQDSVLFDRSLLGDLITTTTSNTVQQNGNTITTENEVIQGATLSPGFNFNNLPLGNSGSDLSRSTSSDFGGQALTHFSLGRTNSTLGYGGLVLSASSENINILIRALSESRKVKVLSRPQVTTLDNQPAFVLVGQRVPRITSTSFSDFGQTNSITQENVGLVLGVTPRISPEGQVVMEIDVENSSVGPESEGIPISIAASGDVIRSPRIDTTTAQTTVSAANGQTIVLGGLIREETNEVRRRIPYLSKIPVIKHLFRYDLVTKQRNELLIIMTPRVIYSEMDAERIKQEEAARMHWCLADVHRIHGDAGLRGRTSVWTDAEVPVFYPDSMGEVEMVPTPAVPQEGEVYQYETEQLPLPPKTSEPEMHLHSPSHSQSQYRPQSTRSPQSPVQLQPPNQGTPVQSRMIPSSHRVPQRPPIEPSASTQKPNSEVQQVGYQMLTPVPVDQSGVPQTLPQMPPQEPGKWHSGTTPQPMPQSSLAPSAPYQPSGVNQAYYQSPDEEASENPYDRAYYQVAE